MREKTFQSRLRGTAQLVALLLFFSVLFFAQVSSAFPAEVQIYGKVSLGEHPKLILTATEAAQNVRVSLTRDDGRQYNYSLGNVVAGFEKEIALDAHPGKHRYEGTMQAKVDGEEIKSPLAFATVVAPPLSISVDRASVDLEQRSLSFKTSRRVHRFVLTVIGIEGQELESDERIISDWKKGQPIAVSWPATLPSQLLRLELRVEDEDGFFNAVALTPWSVEIPHEEVLFASGSAKIADTESAKLEASLAEITTTLKRFSQIQGVQLFIAGHTDTVGSASYNQNLSRKRAQAIAAWFVRHRVPLRVSFEGFGEAAPRVKTADEVEEAKNRRVDYILSVEAPVLNSKAHGWKRLN